jgi:hypothetical protein
MLILNAFSCRWITEETSSTIFDKDESSSKREYMRKCSAEKRRKKGLVNLF